MERTILSVVVLLVFAATVWRCLAVPQVHSIAVFLAVCAFAQLVLIRSLLFNGGCAHVAHVIFTGSMWIGALFLPQEAPEHHIVLGLCVFTLITRCYCGHCMLSHARGETCTNRPVFHLLYALPLVFAVLRHRQTTKKRIRHGDPSNCGRPSRNPAQSCRARRKSAAASNRTRSAARSTGGSTRRR